ITQQTMLEMCQKGRRFAGAYLAAIRGGRVFYMCCSRHLCEASSIRLGEEAITTDLELLLGLIQEVATELQVNDTYMSFNIGDQPMFDKAYYGPAPQFHWVSSAGHWNVPLPNPFHLK
ncbi:unnamed protein product, partial [Polarella glacialis]